MAEENEPYLGDLGKTDALFTLVQTPVAERDEAWQASFLDNIAQASFRCGDPQVVTGPDGFPYFQLFLPEPNQPFQCFVIERLADDFLLASGVGVVINPAANRADWVLSYGDIVNWHLNKTFYTTTETAFSREAEDGSTAEHGTFMIGQPSENILPAPARQQIAEFLKSNGVASPKVLLMMQNRKDGKGISQGLVFNVTPDHFQDETMFGSVMQALGWYLPRHYLYKAMAESGPDDGFMPL